MTKIKKIDTLSFIKFQAVVSAIVGFVVGILYSFGGLIYDALVSYGLITSTTTPGLSYGTVLAFGALVGMPIIFAAFGSMIGFTGAVIYNLVAKWFGGIEVEFEK